MTSFLDLPSLQTFVTSIGDQWMLHYLVVSLLVVSRLAGLVIALPSIFFGVPIRFRALLIGAIAFVIAPTVASQLPLPGDQISIPQCSISVIRELIFGLVVGGVVQLLVVGGSMAGELVANATGMQLAQTADPTTGESVPQLSRFLGVVITAILFAAGGHRILIDALLTSFDRFPPSMGTPNSTTPLITQPMAKLVFDHLAIAVESGLRVAAPVVACVLVTNIVVAIISRAVPQLNVLAIGMNINILAALVVMALTIGSAGLVFETELARAIAQMGLD